MGRCDVCGNDDEKTMVVTIADRSGRCCCRARRAKMAGVAEHKVNA